MIVYPLSRRRRTRSCMRSCLGCVAVLVAVASQTRMTRDGCKARARLPEPDTVPSDKGNISSLSTISLSLIGLIPQPPPPYCNSISKFNIFILPHPDGLGQLLSRVTGPAPFWPGCLWWRSLDAPAELAPVSPETHAEDVSAQTRIRISRGGFVSGVLGIGSDIEI